MRAFASLHLCFRLLENLQLYNKVTQTCARTEKEKENTMRDRNRNKPNAQERRTAQYSAKKRGRHGCKRLADSNAAQHGIVRGKKRNQKAKEREESVKSTREEGGEEGQKEASRPKETKEGRGGSCLCFADNGCRRLCGGDFLWAVHAVHIRGCNHHQRAHTKPGRDDKVQVQIRRNRGQDDGDGRRKPLK